MIKGSEFQIPRQLDYSNMDDMSFLNNSSTFDKCHGFEQLEEQQQKQQVPSRIKGSNIMSSNYYQPQSKSNGTNNGGYSTAMNGQNNGGSSNNSNLYDQFDAQSPTSQNNGDEGIFGYDMASANGYEDQIDGTINGNASSFNGYSQPDIMLGDHSSTLQQSSVSNEVDGFNEIHSQHSRQNLNEILPEDVIEQLGSKAGNDNLANMFQVSRGATIVNGEDLSFTDNAVNTYGQTPSHQQFNSVNSSMVRTLPMNMYKLQYDPNPVILKRMSNEKKAVYRQNINIRYLKPPKPPLPGPLIIREVRPPQPPAAPPLIIRQRPPRAPTPPPLVLRERPPQPPVIPGPQIIKKQLPSLPPPARQVIIERYPQLPPKPRDIIVERWLPYDKIPKRTVVYQRAAPVKFSKPQKNLIVYYQSTQPIIQRTIRRHNAVRMDPQDYIHRYAATLLDKHSIVEQVHKAGVGGELVNALVRNFKQDANQDVDLNSTINAVPFQRTSFGNESLNMDGANIEGLSWNTSTGHGRISLNDALSQQYDLDSNKHNDPWLGPDDNSIQNLSGYSIYDHPSRSTNDMQVENGKYDDSLVESVNHHSNFSELPISASAFMMHESGEFPDSLNEQFLNSAQLFNQSGMNSIDINSTVNGDNKYILNDITDADSQFKGIKDLEEDGHM